MTHAMNRTEPTLSGIRSTAPLGAGARAFRALGLTCLALLTLGGATACATPTKRNPIERTVLAANEKAMWDALRVAINEMGYKVGAGANPSTRTIQSGWRLDLYPYKGGGFRTRINADYEPNQEVVDERYEAFDVVIRVDKDTNESNRPLEIPHAKWERADDDAEVARQVIIGLEAILGTAQIQLTERDKPLGID